GDRGRPGRGGAFVQASLVVAAAAANGSPAPVRRYRRDSPGGRSSVIRRAVYPGSFDPFTNGHLDVVERALGIFDRLIVEVAANTDKRQPLSSVEERVNLINETLKGHDRVEVASYSGVTVEYASSRGANTLVKGLRADSDFDAE